MMKYFIKTILVSICCIIGITIDLYAQLPAGYIYYVYSDLNDCIEEARSFFNDSSATCSNNGAGDYDDYWNRRCHNRNSNKKFYVVDSIDENNYRFNYSIVYECVACEYGQGHGLVSMTDLVEGGLEPYIDYDDNQTFFGENLWELGDLEGTFREGVVFIHGNEEPHFCVPCLSTESHEWSGWEEYNGNVYRREYWGICSQFIEDGPPAQQHQYGCKAGTYKVSGSDASTVCAACPEHANCATTNGHTSGILSCKDNYYKSGNSCVACAAGYYLSGGACVAVGTGYWSAAGESTRTACSNKPANSHYTNTTATSSNCPWTCDDTYTQNGNVCEAPVCVWGAWTTHIAANHSVKRTDTCGNTEYGCAQDYMCYGMCNKRRSDIICIDSMVDGADVDLIDDGDIVAAACNGYAGYFLSSDDRTCVRCPEADFTEDFYLTVFVMNEKAMEEPGYDMVNTEGYGYCFVSGNKDNYVDEKGTFGFADGDCYYTLD